MKRIKIGLLLIALLMCTAASAQTHEVLIETTEGNIRIMLYDDTPLHRDNFLKLVDEHFYDSLLFHRVIKYFMIQTGDPKSRTAQPGETLGGGDLGYTIPAEILTPTHYHRRGAVAMAREGDAKNPERRSSACQFYIVWGKTYSTKELEAIQEKVLKNTNGKTNISSEMFWTYRKVGGSPHLDGQYTVFGEVVEGLDVVERIQQAFTDDYNRPVDDIRIIRFTRK
ncbi:MAG: peptidylprolyl isomerase [Prevotella sp.]|nr:peptidylprolyl isomerase [Prevotella sp.]